MSRSDEVSYEPFSEAHVEGGTTLCRELSWPSYTDPTTVASVLRGPGAVTWIARCSADVVGLAHLLTDGCIQAHLSLVGVLPDYRGRGIARALIDEAFRAGGRKWLDLVSEPGSEEFYRSFVHQERAGFRIYPSPRAAVEPDEPVE